MKYVVYVVCMIGKEWSGVSDEFHTRVKVYRCSRFLAGFVCRDDYEEIKYRVACMNEKE